MIATSSRLLVLAGVAAALAGPLGVAAQALSFVSSTTFGGGWTLEARYSGPAPSGASATFGFQGAGVGQTAFTVSANFPDTGVVHFTAQPPAAASELARSSSISVHLGNGAVVAGTEPNQLSLPVSELRQANALAVQDSGGQRLFAGSVDAQAPSGGSSGGGQTGFGGGDGAGGQPGSGTGSGTGQGGQGSGGSGLVPCTDAPCTLQELTRVAENVFNWLIVTAGAAAVLAVVIAGVRYIVAVLQGADSGSIAEAKQSLMYAIVGTVILLVSYTLIRTIYLALGGSGSVPGLGGV